MSVPGQRLFTGAADAYKQSVAALLTDHPSDT